jgi:hypothetical protein
VCPTSGGAAAFLSCWKASWYYVQYMALPASLLAQLPATLWRGGEASSLESSPSVLELGGELDTLLPDGGLPRGTVTELSVAGGAASATSVALAACRAAQAASLQRGEAAPWCAFVDPSATLYGPGVAAAGIQVDRLLVVRPSLDALERTAIRLAESHAFSVLVVDTVGALGKSLSVPLGVWPRIVRRLALGAQESGACVLLVTDAEVPRPLPLPVALRLELSRPSSERLGVRVAKDRRGRVSSPRSIAWGRQRAKALELTPRINRVSA